MICIPKQSNLENCLKNTKRERKINGLRLILPEDKNRDVPHPSTKMFVLDFHICSVTSHIGHSIRKEK